LSISAQVKQLLLEQGFDKKFGARPLRRIIQSKVQTPLAKFLLEHERPLIISALVDQDSVKIEHKKAPVG
jgi:ATP-dependent Clp protease ATP-binding subunit ClpE